MLWSMRTNPLASIVLAAFVVIVAGACSNGVTAPGGPGSSSGGGVGAACDPTNTCRSGLACGADGKCAPAGTTADGSPCTIGGECVSGNCGMKRTCDPSGPGGDGASCGGDADCAKGFRCAFDGTGFFPKCIPSGTVDYGGSCAETKDCFQGLFCNGGKCDNPPPIPPGTDAPPKGIPPYIPSLTSTPWPGATCKEGIKTGTVTARFHVPRSGDPADGDFYKLPFPNDAARDKSGKVSYANHPHDPKPPMGFDAVKRYLDVLETEPFGNYPTMFFTFDGEFDFASIDPSGDDPQVRLVDLTGPETDATFGQRRGLSLFVTNGRNRYICNNYLAIRPNRGDVLRSGGTYAVVVKKGVKTKSDGSLVKADADLIALLAASAPSDAALADAYTAYQPLRDYLAKVKIAAADVVTATVFTVGKPQLPAAKLRASVRAITAAPAIKSWTLCKAGATSPCPQHDGDRGCGTADPAFDELHALIDVPIFQQGTAPYLTDGGAIDVSKATTTPVRTEQVCMALTVPKGTPPATGWPVAIYAHGTGGSFRSHAIDGTSAMLSSVDLGGGTKVGFAVLGIDQVGHGPRRGTSTASPNDLVFNFANPAAARFNYLQGSADQHTLVRALETLSVDATVTGTAIKFDAAHSVYWGHSQGATEGALFLASDASLKGAVLSGEGGGLIEALLTKTQPVDIKDVLWIALSEANAKSVDIWHPVLSLLQNWVDPADPIHFAALDVLPPAPSGATAFARNVFQPSGTKDSYTPFEVQLGFAIEGGLKLVDPILDAKLTTVPSAQGNVAVGTQTATAAFRQYPAGTYDGHFVAFKNDQAKGDVQKFLARVAHGEVPKLPE